MEMNVPALPLDDAGSQGMQRFEFSSAEFLGSNGPERVKKCHEFAADAEKLAGDAANPEMRKAYLDLGRQWQVLADEIDKIENGQQQTGDG